MSGRGERPRWFLAYNGHHIGVCARWADEGYGETIADELDEVVVPPPTHWMPLPPPPQAAPAAQPVAWQPIETAPRDGTLIIGWCVHAADPYYSDDGKRLTIYGGHTEGLSHVIDGPHIVQWGGAFDDSTWEAPGAWLPDWWFQYGSEFEVTANPTHWMPLPPPPEADTQVKP